mmetsp:Transcript_5886/g.14568  ORF Transcript_5886/g.14568 Transcript_5886/m.14568 type:complete len:227 (-) Transcript_5886:4-684(-)
MSTLCFQKISRLMSLHVMVEELRLLLGLFPHGFSRVLHFLWPVELALRALIRLLLVILARLAGLRKYRGGTDEGLLFWFLRLIIVLMPRLVGIHSTHGTARSEQPRLLVPLGVCRGLGRLGGVAAERHLHGVHEHGSPLGVGIVPLRGVVALGAGAARDRVRHHRLHLHGEEAVLQDAILAIAASHSGAHPWPLPRSAAEALSTRRWPSGLGLYCQAERAPEGLID